MASKIVIEITIAEGEESVVVLDLEWSKSPGPDPWKARTPGILAARSGKWSNDHGGNASFSGKTSSGNPIVVILNGLSSSWWSNPFSEGQTGDGFCRRAGESTTTTVLTWEVISVY